MLQGILTLFLTQPTHLLPLPLFLRPQAAVPLRWTTALCSRHATYTLQPHEGGVLYPNSVPNPTLTLPSSPCVSQTSGGGAIEVDDGSVLTARNVHFARNFAGFGGAIGAAARGVVNAFQCTFHRNFATTSGGGVSVIMNSVAKVRKSKFYANVAGVSAGWFLIPYISFDGGKCFGEVWLQASSVLWSVAWPVSPSFMPTWQGKGLLEGYSDLPCHVLECLSAQKHLF